MERGRRSKIEDRCNCTDPNYLNYFSITKMPLWPLFLSLINASSRKCNASVPIAPFVRVFSTSCVQQPVVLVRLFFKVAVSGPWSR